MVPYISCRRLPIYLYSLTFFTPSNRKKKKLFSGEKRELNKGETNNNTEYTKQLDLSSKKITNQHNTPTGNVMIWYMVGSCNSKVV